MWSCLFDLGRTITDFTATSLRLWDLAGRKRRRANHRHQTGRTNGVITRNIRRRRVKKVLLLTRLLKRTDDRECHKRANQTSRKISLTTNGDVRRLTRRRAANNTRKRDGRTRTSSGRNFHLRRKNNIDHHACHRARTSNSGIRRLILHHLTSAIRRTALTRRITRRRRAGREDNQKRRRRTRSGRRGERRSLLNLKCLANLDRRRRTLLLHNRDTRSKKLGGQRRYRVKVNNSDSDARRVKHRLENRRSNHKTIHAASSASEDHLLLYGNRVQCARRVRNTYTGRNNRSTRLHDNARRGTLEIKRRQTGINRDSGARRGRKQMSTRLRTLMGVPRRTTLLGILPVKRSNCLNTVLLNSRLVSAITVKSGLRYNTINILRNFGLTVRTNTGKRLLLVRQVSLFMDTIGVLRGLLLNGKLRKITLKIRRATRKRISRRRARDSKWRRRKLRLFFSDRRRRRANGNGRGRVLPTAVFRVRTSHCTKIIPRISSHIWGLLRSVAPLHFTGIHCRVLNTNKDRANRHNEGRHRHLQLGNIIRLREKLRLDNIARRKDHGENHKDNSENQDVLRFLLDDANGGTGRLGSDNRRRRRNGRRRSASGRNRANVPWSFTNVNERVRRGGDLLMHLLATVRLWGVPSPPVLVRLICCAACLLGGRPLFTRFSNRFLALHRIFPFCS